MGKFWSLNSKISQIGPNHKFYSYIYQNGVIALNIHNGLFLEPLVIINEVNSFIFPTFLLFDFSPFLFPIFPSTPLLLLKSLQLPHSSLPCAFSQLSLSPSILSNFLQGIHAFEFQKLPQVILNQSPSISLHFPPHFHL